MRASWTGRETPVQALVDHFRCPDIVAEFVREYPDIHVELSLSSKVVDLVDEGFDIGIRAGRSRDASLVVRRLGNAALGLYGSLVVR